MCNDALCFLLVPCITSVGRRRFYIKPRSLPHAATSQIKLQETRALQLPPPQRDRIMGTLPPPRSHSWRGDMHFILSQVLLPTSEHDRLKLSLS